MITNVIFFAPFCVYILMQIFIISVCTYVGLAITEIIPKRDESLNTLTIMWTPAINQYCEVMHYLILVYSNEYSSIINESQSSMSTVFADVKLNTHYNITVIAFNEAGNISDSKFNVNVITGQSCIPMYMYIVI